MSSTPTSLLDQIREKAQEFYGTIPHLITTNRSGQLDGAWFELDGTYRPCHPEAAPLSQQRTGEERLAHLVLSYLDHPQAESTRCRRNPRFPGSGELNPR